MMTMMMIIKWNSDPFCLSLFLGSDLFGVITCLPEIKLHCVGKFQERRLTDIRESTLDKERN